MMRRWRGVVAGLAVGACLGLAGGALADELGGDAAEVATEGQLEDYDDLYFGEEDVPEANPDPWEGMNRGIFAFNEFADRWAIEPVAKGWDFIFPDFAQRSLRNFFENTNFPIRFVNDWLQWKPKAAGTSLARFLLNTTIGVAGFMDPASAIGLPASNEDFGQTLGVWGVPTGPYLVLPIFGPSSVRGGTGMAVDSVTRAAGFFVPWWVSIIDGTTGRLNDRSMVIDLIASERAAALDWYSAVRSAYTQRREALVEDRVGGGGGGTYQYYRGADEADAIP